MEMFKTTLEEHPSFKGLATEYHKLIADYANDIEFKAGKILFKEGDDADKFYLIQSGKIALEIFAPGRGSITIQTLGKNEIVGWSWLIPPYHWHFDARCLEDSHAITIDGKALRNRCEADPQFGYQLLKRFSYTLVERLQRTRMQLVDIYGTRY